MGWLTGWTYRKKHTIDQTANAGADYQIGIKVYKGAGTDGTEVVGGITMGKVYCGGNCRDDFGDIRFTEDDGETELSYWADPVNYVSGTSRVFWVKVTDDINAGNVDIYVYYDKADATTTSNFDNAFIFGDPWTNAVLDAARWTLVDGNPTYSIDAVNHYLEVTLMDSSWSQGKGFHSKTLTFPSRYRIEDAYSGNGLDIFIASTTSELTQIAFAYHTDGVSGADWGTAIGIVNDAWVDENNHVYYAGVGGNLDWNSGRVANGAGVTYEYRFTRDGTNIEVEIDGVSRVDEANADEPISVHLVFGRLTTYGFGTGRIGAFKIRKYVSPEPTHDTWGGEETEPPAFQGERSSIVPIMQVLNII